MKSIKSIFIGIITGFLGAWGGASGTDKNWRRLLIPGIITLLALFTLRNWWCLTIMLMAGAFSMGYGIPDPPDSGSSLGRFWCNLFNSNELWANVFTRGTIGLMVGLSLLSIPILKGNWIAYIIGANVIKLTYAIFNWRDLGGFWFRGKYLLWSDFITYGMVGLIASIIIYF